MNRPELFDTTIQTLVQAYFDGTLRAGDCRACAVGNICGSLDWADIFMTTPTWHPHDPYEQYTTPYLSEADKEFIASTGYNLVELMRIEWAFETAVKPLSLATPYDNSAEAMFTRLMAVVSVLSEIHEAGTSAHEAARRQFVKEPVAE